MTIIQPNREKKRFHPAIVLIIGLLVGLLGTSVYLYNKNVNLAHVVRSQEADIASLEEVTTTLENEVFAALDIGSFGESAEALGFIKARRVDYVFTDVRPTSGLAQEQ